MNASGGYTPTIQLENFNAPGEKVISEKEFDKEFKCRICGHDRWEYRFNLDAYVCVGCSVVFENLELFTQKLGDEI